MDLDSLEVIAAIRATLMASFLCQEVRKHLIQGESILKDDRSPVTVADYGSQAIINKLIKETFPNDIIVAEEDSKELQKAEYSKVLGQVADHVHSLIPNTSPQEICSWIDFSSHSVADRFWTLDPIDGTKGFIRGDQYAIALALVENGAVKLGVLVCPNLYVKEDQPHGEKGCLFWALQGKGSFQMDLEGGGKHVLSVSKVENPSEASYTESVESDHADHLSHQRIAQTLKISKPPLRMDSQAKYGIVARGEVTFYLRVPSSSGSGYKERIWDHAAGSIVVEEAGGKVTDVLGRPLDFSCGTGLEKNYGILVTNGMIHDLILDALKK